METSSIPQKVGFRSETGPRYVKSSCRAESLCARMMAYSRLQHRPFQIFLYRESETVGKLLGMRDYNLNGALFQCTTSYSASGFRLDFRFKLHVGFSSAFRNFFFFGSEYEGLVATISREQATDEIQAPSGIFRVFKSGCRHLLTRNTPSFLGRQIFLVRCASLLIGSVK